MVLRKHKAKINQQNKLKINIKDSLNSLLKTLNILRKIWQFLGVVPIMGTSKILMRSQKLWCLILWLLIWTMCLNHIRHLINNGTTLTKVFKLCEMIFYTIIVSGIYFISFVHKRKLLQIHKNLLTLHERLKMCQSSEIHFGAIFYLKLKREIILSTLFQFVFYLFCFTILIIYHGFTLKIFRLFFAYYVPNILNSANLTLFWLALRIISFFYTYSNNILQSLHVSLHGLQLSTISNMSYFESSLWYQREFYTFNFKNSFKVLDILITITEIHTSLDDHLRDIIDVFRPVLLFNFANSFIIMAIQYFAVYKFFDSPNIDTLIVFFLKFALLLVHTLNIIVVLLSNSGITKEKCNTLYILNTFPTDSVDMERTISQYLMQQMVRKHTVSVFDIFELDLTFVFSIISALSAYVIFLIQVDLSATSLEKTIANAT